MNFSQRIYFNDKPLILTTDKEAFIQDDPSAESFTAMAGATLRNYTQAIQHLERPGIKGVIIEDVSEDVLLDQLHAMYTSIDAGGGIAYNELGELLMIFRRGKWDLPKGKLDKGESIEDCALREVSEETGLVHLTLGDKICDTYHIYTLKGEQMLKRTAWYKMGATSSDTLQPQEEENIMEARWVHPNELKPLADKAYEAIREVLKRAGLTW